MNDEMMDRLREAMRGLEKSGAAVWAFIWWRGDMYDTQYFSTRIIGCDIRNMDSLVRRVIHGDAIVFISERECLDGYRSRTRLIPYEPGVSGKVILERAIPEIVGLFKEPILEVGAGIEGGKEEVREWVAKEVLMGIERWAENWPERFYF